MGSTITLNREIRDIILEEGGTDVYKCYQCGKCMGVCPWYHLKKVLFPTYQMPQSVKLGAIIASEDKEEIEKEVTEIYRCIGCEACVNECPRGVNLPNIIRAIRRILVNYGSYPQELKTIVSKIYNVGNPFGEPKEKRTQWTRDLDVPIFTPDKKSLLFTCCMLAYDSRLKKVAHSTVEVFKKADFSFGIAGEDEQCCGESIRRAGAEKVFCELVKSNAALFKRVNACNILTTSPHCYSAFKKEYPKLDTSRFEVFHSTQIFAKLVREKRIIPKKPLNKRVVYHDPCTLGRQNKIYDEPREVLRSIPGLELVEIENFSREYSLCCGGGSGGLWLDWPMDERMVDIRIKQVLDVGAEILAVACPYCLSMFEASIKTMDVKIEVKDISELLVEAL